MDVSFTFRDFEATEGLKDHALNKFDKMDKYLLKPISAHIIFSKEGALHKAEITVTDSGITYIGADATSDMYLALDRAVERILKQLKKHKEKIKNHHK